MRVRALEKRYRKVIKWVAYLELSNLIDEFCLCALEFAALIRISSRFNAEEMMVIDADKPNTLCNSLKRLGFVQVS